MNSTANNTTDSELTDLLRVMVEKAGTAIYLSVGTCPKLKIDGFKRDLGISTLSSDQMTNICRTILSPEDIETFKAKREFDVALSVKSVGRFRVNLFFQRSEVGIVIHNVKTSVPTLEELSAPAVISKLVRAKTGLILIAGGQGSGRSTTIASFLNKRSLETDDHIVTIETPLEYILKHNKGIVNQREIGLDTASSEEALSHITIQDPDVVMMTCVGNQIEAKAAIQMAETRLVIAGIHATDTVSAIEKIISFYPDGDRSKALADLSSSLRVVVTQKLVAGMKGTRKLASEVFVNTEKAKRRLRTDSLSSLVEIIKDAEQSGMQTMDDSLVALYLNGEISETETVRNASLENEAKLKIRSHVQNQQKENNQLIGLSLANKG